MVKPPFEPEDLKILARALEHLEEVTKKASGALWSASEYCQEGEDHYNAGEDILQKANKLMDEVERRRLVLQDQEDRIRRDIIRAEGMLADLDKREDQLRKQTEITNKPVIDLLNDVLMALELDESPADIAAELRRQHTYLDAKW